MILVAVAVVVGSLTFARDAQSPTPAEAYSQQWIECWPGEGCQGLLWTGPGGTVIGSTWYDHWTGAVLSPADRVRVDGNYLSLRANRPILLAGGLG
jgi:hypothetical protein